MNKIVIVSSGQPSANPRAVKEAILLSQNNYDVTFIYCPLSPWADEFDVKLFTENLSIKWIAAGYHSTKNKIGYVYARLRKKYWESINKFFPNNFDSALKSSVLFSQELLQEVQKHKADVYIGHNLGAIGAITKAAKMYNAKVGFDAEDFHRGEHINESKQQQTISSIEDKYFPMLDYCSVASPLIGEVYKAIFPNQHFIVVNNVFSNKYAKETHSFVEKDSLDLFWFSQFIGKNRGLENIIDALNLCDNLNINLHLLGNISDSYKTLLLNKSLSKNRIVFLPPCDPDKIFKIGQQFDIGFASETAFSINRNIALTNKIFTYLLCGNCILLSDTDAQKKFLNDYPNIGFIYQIDNPEELANRIKILYNDRALLLALKNSALKLATDKFNWEHEGQILLEKINELIAAY